MPNNFKLTGTYYFSKSGSPANSGLTKDLPKASPAFFAPSVHVIGTGQYLLASTALKGGVNTLTETVFSGDGTVIIEPSVAGGTLTIGNGDDAGYRVTDLIFRGFGVITFSQRGGASGRNLNIDRCKFVLLDQRSGSITWAENNNSKFATDSIFININTTPGVVFINQALGYDRCIFWNALNIHVNTSVNHPNGAFKIGNSYTPPGSTLFVNAATDIFNCNIQGAIDVNGTLFASASEFKAAYPTSTVYNEDPKFNNSAFEDFTLQSDSPHLTKGIGPALKRYSNSYYTSFQNKQPGDIITAADVSFIPVSGGLNSQVLSLTAGAATFNADGGIIIKPQPGVSELEIIHDKTFNSRVASQLNPIEFVGGLNFNSDFPPTEGQFDPNNPQIFNNNVPDYLNYTSGSAGRNPNRLTYKMRWSILLNPSVGTGTDWVTNTQIDPFLDFEWNVKPTFRALNSDATKLIGNGHPDWSLQSTTIQNVECTWYQMKVILRNNYFSK